MTTTLRLSPSLPASLGRPGPLSELRALGAVARREWLIFRRYPTWVVGLLIWPPLLPAMYIFMARALAGPQGDELALFARATGTTDYVGYILVGTLVWMWQNISLWQIGLALRQEQMRGTLETNWLAPAWRFWFLLGSALTHGLILALTMLVAALSFRLIYGVQLNGSPWLTLLIFLASMPSVYGLGLAFASVVIAAREANAFVMLVRGLVMIFCGITYPISVMPDWMQRVAAFLPQTYAIRALRSAALVGADLPALLPDLAALLLFGAFWLVAGYLAFNWMDRRARRTGTIAQY